jgi:ribosomal protein S18 acetylase RimI-like enzyme
MSIVFRPMTEADLEVADQILMPAYSGRRRIDELQRYLSFQPCNWQIAYLNDEPAGVGGYTMYDSFAYIALIGVHPRFQQRGIATALMEEMLRDLYSRGCYVAVLDASSASERIYEQLGFVDDDKVLTYVQDDCATRLRTPHSVQPLTSDDMAELVEFDAQVFGAYRQDAIIDIAQRFGHRAFVSRDSQVFAQNDTIGPWSATTQSFAEDLLNVALQLEFDGAPRVLAPSRNRQVGVLLMRYGFSPMRVMRHMRYGEQAVANMRHLYYGQLSFAIG